MLIQQEVKDPRLGLVTINEVKVSRDLGFADVYFTSFSSDTFRANDSLDEDEVRMRKLRNEIASHLLKCSRMRPGFFVLV